MFMVFITIVTGAYKPTNIIGGPHNTYVSWFQMFRLTTIASDSDAIFGEGSGVVQPANQ